jgi:hypothetical protein
MLRESRLSPLFFFNLPLDEVDDVCFEPHVVERVDFLDSSRTDDVHFREIIADDVEPDAKDELKTGTFHAMLAQLGLSSEDL